MGEFVPVEDIDEIARGKAAYEADAKRTADEIARGKAAYEADAKRTAEEIARGKGVTAPILDKTVAKPSPTPPTPATQSIK